MENVPYLQISQDNLYILNQCTENKWEKRFRIFVYLGRVQHFQTKYILKKICDIACLHFRDPKIQLSSYSMWRIISKYELFDTIHYAWNSKYNHNDKWYVRIMVHVEEDTFFVHFTLIFNPLVCRAVLSIFFSIEKHLFSRFVWAGTKLDLF